MSKKLFILVLISFIFWNLGHVIFLHRSAYLSTDYWQGFSQLRQTYLDSQYVNKHPKGWVPDEVVNSYAGGAYIRGVAPYLIAPDTPPLGRYLIGISAVVFHNANIVILLSMLISLYILYVIGEQIYQSKIIALCVVAMVTSEPIILNQLIFSPLLDIIQLVFLLSCFYYFNLALTKHTLFYFFISNIFLGCFMATKFFATGATIIISMMIILFIHRYGKKILLYIGTLPISFIVLLATYVRAFVYGYSLKQIIGIQKWVFLYHKSQLILPFSIWPLLLFNRWYVWFGSKPIITDPQWRITWPMITIMTGITILLYVLRKIPRKIEIEIYMAWVVSYIFFFSFGQISSRYLVIYIPILYLIATYGLWHMSLWLYTTYRRT